MTKATHFALGKVCCFCFPPGYAQRAYRERCLSSSVRRSEVASTTGVGMVLPLPQVLPEVLGLEVI